jgi:hypothetical protein
MAVLLIPIRMHRIHLFLGLLDPDPDPSFRGINPDPAPDPDLEKPRFLLLCDFFLTFIFENDKHVPYL